MCRRILRNTEIKSPGLPAPLGDSGNTAGTEAGREALRGHTPQMQSLVLARKQGLTSFQLGSAVSL